MIEVSKIPFQLSSYIENLSNTMYFGLYINIKREGYEQEISRKEKTTTIRNNNEKFVNNSDNIRVFPASISPTFFFSFYRVAETCTMVSSFIYNTLIHVLYRSYPFLVYIFIQCILHAPTLHITQSSALLSVCALTHTLTCRQHSFHSYRKIQSKHINT